MASTAKKSRNILFKIVEQFRAYNNNKACRSVRLSVEKDLYKIPNKQTEVKSFDQREICLT
jgi:hypothetical protein